MKLRRSLHEYVVRALDSSAEQLREAILDELGPSVDDAPRGYDRRRTARKLLGAFAREANVEHSELDSLGDAFAASLPEHLEDLDGAVALEWLEESIPISWNEDRPLLEPSIRAELIADVLAALAESVEGEMTPAQRSRIAKRVFERVRRGTSLATERTTTAREKSQQEAFAELFIMLAWGSRREPEVRAERAVVWLERELHICWGAPAGERPYSNAELYAVGEVVVHPRFGRGTVKWRADSALEIAFADCVRKLAVVRSE